MTTTHELKCWPAFFQEVYLGRKNFEIRKADRDYQLMDTLRLREWDPVSATYTGRECERSIGYMLHAEGGMEMLAAGHVVLSLVSTPRDAAALREAWEAGRPPVERLALPGTRGDPRK